MLKRTLILIVLVSASLLYPNDAAAQRKGFIVGFGLGPGFTSHELTVSFDQQSVAEGRETSTALMTDFKIGFAPTDQIMAYWTSNVSWFGVEFPNGDNEIVTHGVGGLGVTYFLAPASPSLFVNGGLGFSTWSTPFDFDTSTSNDVLFGLGGVVGAGFEFSKHWVAQLDLLLGSPGETNAGVEARYSNRSLKFTLNFLWY